MLLISSYARVEKSFTTKSSPAKRNQLRGEIILFQNEPKNEAVNKITTKKSLNLHPNTGLHPTILLPCNLTEQEVALKFASVTTVLSMAAFRFVNNRVISFKPIQNTEDLLQYYFKVRPSDPSNPVTRL